MLMEINNLSDTSPSFKKAEVVGKGEGYLNRVRLFDKV